MNEGLASLDTSVKLIIELPVEQLHNVSILLPFPEERKGKRNSYTMGCPPVRGDNPRALASGLSYVQVDKHGITNF